MAQVPEKVLSWLYSVLHEYQDPQRTYSDVARTLSAYPSLSPRTEVYTYEHGASALLLTVSGTLPVDFRGTTYRFPIKLWVPQAYPQESPMVFVTPGRDMIVRPGQHVGVDGRVYHPYLRDWSGMWDRASISEFLAYLQQAFAREPPVVGKAQQQQFQRPMGTTQQQAPGASPAPPQLPPKQRPGSIAPVEMPSTSTPPPRPPKPGDDTSSMPSRDVTRDGPPLPPLPGERPPSMHYAPSPQHAQNGYTAPLRQSSQSYQQPPAGYHDGQPTGPPLPPIPPHVQQQHVRTDHDRSPVSPVSPARSYAQMYGQQYQQTHPVAHPQQHLGQQHAPQSQAYPPPQQLPYRPQFQQPAQTQQQYVQGQPYPAQYPPQQMPAQQPPQKKAPPPDLLSDPFDVALPASGPPAPAPPIPPNPEKEHLLQALSASLTQLAQQKVNQNMSALAPLQAQNQALLNAQHRLQSELHQLESLQSTLSSNEQILQRSIQSCDAAISLSSSKPQPPIDEVLVAPTLVAQQLWTLCAEEQAAREAMYVLQKAMDRGRVGAGDFVKSMRGLGRECFLKMVLARKCAKGLGLEA